jgi:tRNA pseudouridine38-40 synthase
MTRRYALRLEYDGQGFVGWQRQANGVSVQHVVEMAAAHLNHGEPVACAAAGRTDAGVHAIAQVGMIALPGDHTPERVLHALNFHIGKQRVSVLDAALAPEGWHPRFAAIGRSYRYVILNRRARPAIESGRVWHLPHLLDVEAMAAASTYLLGRHDFTSFRASACQAKSPIRTLDHLTLRREGERVVMEIAARSFLHHQVRNIIGTLKLVGDGSWPPERVAEALAARHRAAAGPTAPPDGLTLTGVEYPMDVFRSSSAELDHTVTKALAG